MRRFVTFFIGFVFILVFGTIVLQVGLIAWSITNPTSAERVLTETAASTGRILGGFVTGFDEGQK